MVKMKPIKATDENIKKAAEIIREGGTVAFPTETVYGLGANGLDPVAVAKIFSIKKRPSFNPLILHISNKDQLGLICETSSTRIHTLIDKFWPGPLTLVLPKKQIVPEIVTADNPTVAVRIPDNEIALKLIEYAGVPIAAPSANLFNRLSPTTAEHVYKQLKDNVDMILDGGSTDVGVESTIIEIDINDVFLLRPGGVPKEELEKTLNSKIKTKVSSTDPNSPGQLPFHYSPRTPLYFLSSVEKSKLKNKKLGGIFFKENSSSLKFEKSLILSPKGNMQEAAANLFSYLHQLDEMNLDLIVIEEVPEKDLGLAIMDRLRKATANF